MKNTHRFYRNAMFLPLFVTMLTGVVRAESAKRPAWVDGSDHSAYASQQYLTAIGSGRTREEAISDARKEIAQVFQSEVKTQFQKSAKSELSQETSAKTEGKDTQNVSRDLTISSQVQVRGAEIKETYHDSEAQQYFALAVLDKLKVKNLYRLELDGLAKKGEALIGRFKEKPSSQTLDSLVAVLANYDRLNAQYTVLGGAGAMRPITDGGVEELRTKLHSAFAQNLMFIDSDAEDANFDHLLNECLSEKGIKWTNDEADRAQASHFLRVRFKTTPQHQKVDGWVKFQFRAVGELRKARARVGSVVSTRIESCRSEELCVEQANQFLSKDLCEKIVGLFGK